MARTARSSCVVYLPTKRLSEKDNLTRAERWEIVRGALVDHGFTNIRPAPMPSLNYVPRSLRPTSAGARHG